MDPIKKKPSGHAYRKKTLEKKQQEEKLVKQTPKIDTYFNKRNDQPSSSSRFNDLEQVIYSFCYSFINRVFHIKRAYFSLSLQTVVADENGYDYNLKASNSITKDHVATNITDNFNTAADTVTFSASLSDLTSTVSLPEPFNEDAVATGKSHSR